MKKQRTSFVYYTDWAKELLKYPDDLRLKIDDAVKRYVLYGEEPTDREVIYSMFGLMRTQLDRDDKKWTAIRNKRSEAGKRHNGNQYTKRNKTEQMEQMFQNGTNGTVNVNDNVNGNMISSSNEDVSTLQVGPEAKPIVEKIRVKPSIAFERLAAFWNNTMAGKGVKQISKLTEKRKAAVSAREREYGKDAIETAIRKVAESKFLNGDNDRAWVASFDWLFLPKNFPKVLEGNYENRPTSHRQTILGDTEQEQRKKGAANIIASLMAEEKE